MDQKANNRTTGMTVGILSLLLSLPAGWFAITQAKSASTFMLPVGPVTATGLSGKVGLWGLQLPLWLVISLGILSLVFATLNRHGITSLPRLAVVAPWLISAIHVLAAVVLGLSANNVSLQIGPMLAAVGLGLGLVSGFAELSNKAAPVALSPQQP